MDKEVSAIILTIFSDEVIPTRPFYEEVSYLGEVHLGPPKWGSNFERKWNGVPLRSAIVPSGPLHVKGRSVKFLLRKNFTPLKPLTWCGPPGGPTLPRVHYSLRHTSDMSGRIVSSAWQASEAHRWASCLISSQALWPVLRRIKLRKDRRLKDALMWVATAVGRTVRASSFFTPLERSLQ